MKVLTLNTTFSRGGAAKIARTLHHAVKDSRGHESLFAYGRGLRNQERDAVRFAVQPEIYLHALLTRSTGIQGYGTPLSTKRLLRLIQRWTPDVIHVHNIHGYYLDLSIARAVRELGIPVVWTLHDAWPLTGRCAYFLECNRWLTGCGNCPDLSSYPKTYWDSSAMMWPKKRELLGGAWSPVIVAPSQWLADLVSEACDGRCRVEVIPNGIDMEIFQPGDRSQLREKLGWPKDKKIVLTAAADLRCERKGVRYFLESLSFVEADGWMVVTVGEPVALPQGFKHSVDIRQLGYMGGEKSMAEVYAAADLFCVTSLDESFGLVVLESLACGTPVVGFSVGGIRDQVSEGCGLLVPSRDTKALGSTITTLLRDDDLRHAMGRRCRERAVDQYDEKTFSERYLSLYNELGRRGEP